MGKKLSILLSSCFIIVSFSNKSFASTKSSGHISELIRVLSERCRDYDCLYLQQNILRDTKICQPTQEKAFSNPNLRGAKKVKGYILYEGVWPAKYSYTVTPSKTYGYEITIRIHFKNQNEFSSNELNYFQLNLDDAAYLWNENAPSDLYKFKFLIVRDARNADFSVQLTKEDSRGPYYVKWSTAWDPQSIAHEIGHMLGLDDEYGTVIQHSNCNPRSIMCNSPTGSVREYQYYQILKRIHCT